MPYRKVPFVTGEIYHVFNRSIAKQPIFTTKRDFQRSVEMLDFFRYAKPPVKFSYYQHLSGEKKREVKLEKSQIDLEVIAFCLMPNHFHFLLKQILSDGIKRFTSNFQNSYSKYFNLKRKRTGSLFQAMFKGVHIDTDDQLLHVSRYIHLNPVSSFLVSKEKFSSYPWSSYNTYIQAAPYYGFVNNKIVIDSFKSKKMYEKFVMDQVDYQQKLELIKHLLLE